MMGKNYSNYQKQVINNYYENLDNIMLTKLQELVGELYLADSAQKKQKLWQRVEKAMDKLKIKPKIKAHILSKKDVTVLAANLEKWLKSSK